MDQSALTPSGVIVSLQVAQQDSNSDATVIPSCGEMPGQVTLDVALPVVHRVHMGVKKRYGPLPISNPSSYGVREHGCGCSVGRSKSIMNTD